LAGLRFAADLAIDGELQGQFRRIGKVLGATVEAQPLGRSIVADAWRAMDRRTVSYKPALTLIELLLGGQGVALDEQGSRVRLKGFLFDMNRGQGSNVRDDLIAHFGGATRSSSVECQLKMRVRSPRAHE
jgi:hypothetical protein